MNQDESQLNSLSLAHYIVGGIMVLVSCFPLFHVVLGVLFIWGGCGCLPETTNPPPPLFGWLFFILGIVWFLVAQTISILVIVSGRYLKARKRYLFSFIMACIACTFIPLGTVLGVITIIVLSRPTVKELYS